jgi:predicted kinase
MINGEYRWSSENQNYAHSACKNKCEFMMRSGYERVIVANTSTTEKELKPYIDMANMYGYKIFSLIVENRHGGTNSHNVPIETINKMVDRFNIKLF